MVCYRYLFYKLHVNLQANYKCFQGNIELNISRSVNYLPESAGGGGKGSFRSISDEWKKLGSYSGTPELGGGRRGSRPRCPLPGGAEVPFQFKGLPWQNSELSEMLVQFFYEFASENARNAVIELQE